MKSRLITNPFIVNAAAFLFVLLLYTFGWSELYPAISLSFFVFIFSTSLISLIIGLLVNKSGYISYKKISFNASILWMVTIVIIICYFIECAYMGLIPIIAIIRGARYDYTTFGIPTFHVLLATFGSFWSVFVFHNYISTKRKDLLLCFIISLTPAIIIYNRGMLLINLASSFFLLFMSVKNLKKLILRISVFLIVLLFLFGVAGNIRATHGKSINDIILSVGKASPSFKKSVVPDEYFWAYLYITSSLANAQQTINVHAISPFTTHKLGAYINWEYLPDFLAKRNPLYETDKESINQVSLSFNVGTVYARSYAFFGWWGLVAMFIFTLLFNLLFIFIIPKSSIFFNTGIAILNCLMLFNIFDNMFAFSGTSFQLIYPLIFGVFPLLTSKRFHFNFSLHTK